MTWYCFTQLIEQEKKAMEEDALSAYSTFDYFDHDDEYSEPFQKALLYEISILSPERFEAIKTEVMPEAQRKFDEHKEWAKSRKQRNDDAERELFKSSLK